MSNYFDHLLLLLVRRVSASKTGSARFTLASNMRYCSTGDEIKIANY